MNKIQYKGATYVVEAAKEIPITVQHRDKGSKNSLITNAVGGKPVVAPQHFGDTYILNFEIKDRESLKEAFDALRKLQKRVKGLSAKVTSSK